MLPGRCATLGGSRRLTLHSTASCTFSFGPFFAPCRAPHSSRFCDCSAREAVAVTPAGRPSASRRAPLVTARSATADVACGAGADGGPCSGASVDSPPGTISPAAPCKGGRLSSSSACGDGSTSTSTSGSNGAGACGDSGGSEEAGAGAGPGPERLLVEDTTTENWLNPLRRQGSVVALGKFDALHRGHRALAAAAAALAREIHAVQSDGGADPAAPPSAVDAGGGTASTVGAAAAPPGDAVLLSFSGMAAVLGWPDRLPLTAPQDRARVLAGWAAACSGSSSGADGANGNGNRHCNGNGNRNDNSGGGETAQSATPAGTAAAAAAAAAAVVVGPGAPSGAGLQASGTTAAAATVVAPPPPPPPPRLRTLPFSLIRGMAPEQFVALLARDLGAAGVVAGRNYRFGYKAAGDADTLVRLGRQYGMRVEIVDLVTLPDQPTANDPDSDGGGSGTAAAAATEASTRTDRTSSSSSCSSNRGCEAVSTPSAAVSTPSAAVSTPSAAVSTPSAATPGIGDGVAAAAAVAAAAMAARNDAYSTSLESLDGPGGAAADGGRSGGGGGGGSGSGGATGTSSRVSSSRIRALLERGQVESVEQLLGRKYRLVCDLASASVATASSAGSSDSCIENNGSTARSAAKGCIGGGGCAPLNGRAAGGGVRLVLPYASYQNQPPANGQYRALVQLARDSQVLDGPGVGEDWAGWASGGNCGDGKDAAVLTSGGVCVTVALSDSGIEVQLGELWLQAAARLNGGGGLLLVDFDACG